MSLRLCAWLALGGVLVGGCGSARIDFSGQHRQAPPTDLSVYVGDGHLLLSPRHVGAGAVVFNITNQTSRTESVTIRRADRHGALGSSGPINPGSSAQLTVDVASGEYTVATRRICAACIGLAAHTIGSVKLRVGAARQGGNAALLQP